MAQKCRTLAVVDRQYVDFDPTNKDHIEAFSMLCLGVDNDNFRQHPTLRFNIHHPYTDVRKMMFHMVARDYIRLGETVKFSH